jgi:hypothetical protein
MNIVRVNTGTVTGRTTSDMFATGTQARNLSDNNLGLSVAFSGANVNMRADSDWTMTVTGFALDLMNANEATGERGFTGNPNFSNLWGNNNERNARQTEFTNWTRTFAQSVEPRVNLELSSGRIERDFRTNFTGVTVDNVSEVGVYELVIRNGVVERNNDIADRIIVAHGTPSMTRDTAWNMFMDSDVGRSLTRAVVSRTDSNAINGSAGISAEAGVAGVLGGTAGQQWYDEVVRTFVIREFTTTLSIGTVTVSDKLDYAWSVCSCTSADLAQGRGCASRGGTGGGADSRLHACGLRAEWRLDFVVNGRNNMGTDTVLRRVHVAPTNNGVADFVLSISTTSDARQ